MATRYSGNRTNRCVYDDRQHFVLDGDYKCSVTGPGGKWSGRVRPAPASLGPGVGYDSPRAYDEIARSAVSFAESDVPGIMDEANMDSEGRVLIGRSKAHAWGNPDGQERSPAHGRRGAGLFVVRGKSGKVAGRYHTRAEAERRIAQLKAGAARLKGYQFKGR